MAKAVTIISRANMNPNGPKLEAGLIEAVKFFSFPQGRLNEALGHIWQEVEIVQVGDTQPLLSFLYLVHFPSKYFLVQDKHCIGHSRLVAMKGFSTLEEALRFPRTLRWFTRQD